MEVKVSDTRRFSNIEVRDYCLEYNSQLAAFYTENP